MVISRAHEARNTIVSSLSTAYQNSTMNGAVADGSLVCHRAVNGPGHGVPSPKDDGHHMTGSIGERRLDRLDGRPMALLRLVSHHRTTASRRASVLPARRDVSAVRGRLFVSITAG